MDITESYLDLLLESCLTFSSTRTGGTWSNSEVAVDLLSTPMHLRCSVPSNLHSVMSLPPFVSNLDYCDA